MLSILQTVRAGALLAAAAGVAAGVASGLASCGGDETDAHDEGGGHAHEAKYGGALVELGDHFANVEVVLNGEAGTLEVYGWDAHAEEAERVATESLSVSIDVHADEPIVVELAPRVSELSGEKVGDSSYFSVESESLKGVDHCHGTIAELTIMGTKFENVKFDWPPEEHEHDDDEEHDGE